MPRNIKDLLDSMDDKVTGTIINIFREMNDQLKTLTTIVNNLNEQVNKMSNRISHLEKDNKNI